MRKLLTMMTVAMLSLGVVTAQTRVISGKVTDSKGAPVPGATIKLKNGSAVAADEQGNFQINAQSGDVLSITSIDYEMTTAKIGTGSVVTILLTSRENKLSEVVVTALGIRRPSKEIGYATSKISSAELNQGKTVNLQNGLTGKISGLNITTVNSGVTADTKINLRGLRSLTGNNSPLLVVDGIPTPIGYISSINPNDVQDVNVLKGASSAAIYGPDGVNGVIIVTTRRGTKGVPVITVSHTTQFERVAYMPKLQTRFGSGSTVDALGRPEYTAYENQQYGPEFDGSMVALGKPLEDGTLQMVPYTARPDEKKKFWNNGITHQDDVSFSTQDFYISAQNVEIKGLTPNDKSRRTSFRFNSAKEYGKFKAGFNLNYIQTNTDVVNNAAYASRFASSYNGSVYFTVLNTPMQVPLTSYKDPQNQFGQFSNYYNEYFVSPYWVINNHRSVQRSDDLLASMTLDYKIAPWLSATYRLGTNLTFGSYKNSNAAIVVSDFAAANRGQQFRNQPGSVGDGQNFGSRINQEFFLNGKTDYKGFSVNYLAGTQYRQNASKQIDVNGNNLVVPGVYNLSNKTGEAGAGEFNIRNRLVSVFGSVSLSYKGWANVEVVGRNDWDSRLDNKRNSYFYPGVNAALVLSDAIKDLQESNYISYVKLRGSVSKSGNVNLGTYALEALYTQSNGFPYGNLGGFSAANTKPDPNIQPEFVNSKEVGIELGFAKNRINFEGTYYNQKNTNQILNVQQSSATGYPTKTANTADFLNEGVELDLKLTPLINIGRGKVNLNVNATYSKNKILSLADGIPELAIGGTPNFTQRASSSPEVQNYAIVGQPAFVFKTSDYKRDPSGRVIIDKLTGNPQLSDSLVTMGQSLPKWILGFTPSFTIKGFTIGMTWDYRGGHSAYFGMGSDMDFTGISARSAQYGRQRFVFPNSVYSEAGKFIANDNIQTSDGGVNFWTSGALNSQVGTNYFASAASWKLRELAISYEIPASLLGGGKVIKRATVGLVGRNLLIFLPKTNQWTDPEFNYTSAGNTFGISNVFATPPSRTFGGTVTLTF